MEKINIGIRDQFNYTRLDIPAELEQEDTVPISKYLDGTATDYPSNEFDLDEWINLMTEISDMPGVDKDRVLASPDTLFIPLLPIVSLSEILDIINSCGPSDSYGLLNVGDTLYLTAWWD